MSSRLDRNETNANRHSEPIVYCFADGTIQSITMQDYLSAHPEHTEQDFAQIKAVSDSLQRMHDANDRKHNRCRIEEDFDFAAAFIASGDIELCDRLIRAEQRSIAWNAAARLLQAGRLTIAQRRRFIRVLSARQVDRGNRKDGENTKADNIRKYPSHKP